MIRPGRLRVARRLRVGVVLVLVALAGCGQDEPTYAEQVTEVVQAHAAAVARHQADAQASATTDRASSAESLAQLAKELERVATGVERLEPGANQRRDAARLVRAYRQLARAALELRTAVATGDATAARRAQADYEAARVLEREAAAALDGS